MSFSTGQITGPADEIKVEYQYSAGHERESSILEVVKRATEEIASAVGGHVAVSVQGHLNAYDDEVGDNVNVQVSSLLPPAPSAQDAGLDAAAGSARNFPPESSTAAPATEDQSPPAAQQPTPEAQVAAQEAHEQAQALSDAGLAQPEGPTDPDPSLAATEAANDAPAGSVHDEPLTLSEVPEHVEEDWAEQYREAVAESEHPYVGEPETHPVDLPEDSSTEDVPSGPSPAVASEAIDQAAPVTEPATDAPPVELENASTEPAVSTASSQAEPSTEPESPAQEATVTELPVVQESAHETDLPPAA